MQGYIADYVEHEKPDAVAHAGDLYEDQSEAIERQAGGEWCQRITEVSPLVILGGNHEAKLEVEELRRLKSVCRIYATERPEVVMLDQVVIACMPWPTKTGVLRDAAAMALDDVNEEAGRALEAILRSLDMRMGHASDYGQTPTMLLMHAMVRGSVSGTGQPLVGCDFEIDLSTLSLCRAQAYALAHIHKAQDWMLGDAPVVYCGSAYHTDYGAPEPKSFTVWNIEPGKPATFERIPLPATPMILAEAHWNDEEKMLSVDPCLDCIRGSEIRLRYHVPPEFHKVALASAEQIRRIWRDAGAVDVKLDPIIQTVTRARAPEVATALSDEDKLIAFWASNNTTPEEPTRTRLIDKLRQLKGQQPCV